MTNHGKTIQKLWLPKFSYLLSKTFSDLGKSWQKMALWRFQMNKWNTVHPFQNYHFFLRRKEGRKEEYNQLLAKDKQPSQLLLNSAHMLRWRIEHYSTWDPPRDKKIGVHVVTPDIRKGLGKQGIRFLIS